MTGVVLLNLGGPDSPGSVRPFLYNLFSDRRIIKLGPGFMQKPLAWLISATRARKARAAYGLIGGSSPLLRITRAQAGALAGALEPSGDYRVYVGMKYWHPFIEEAIAEAHAAGITRLIALSLYPHYSAATTGSSETALKECIRRYPIKFCTVPPWYDHPLYIEALAGTVGVALKSAGPGAEVLFSAHSLPASLIAGGDPYAGHINATIKAVAERVPMKWHLGYQSRSGPVKWLGPSTDDVIRELAAGGVKDLVVVPVSFVSDHIETLYEIDILYKGIAGDLGVRLTRAESLNTNPKFIEALADLVLTNEAQLKW